jgi:hypothetical protein
MSEKSTYDNFSFPPISINSLFPDLGSGSICDINLNSNQSLKTGSELRELFGQNTNNISGEISGNISEPSTNNANINANIKSNINDQIIGSESISSLDKNPDQNLELHSLSNNMPILDKLIEPSLESRERLGFEMNSSDQNQQGTLSSYCCLIVLIVFLLVCIGLILWYYFWRTNEHLDVILHDDNHDLGDNDENQKKETNKN